MTASKSMVDKTCPALRKSQKRTGGSNPLPSTNEALRNWCSPSRHVLDCPLTTSLPEKDLASLHYGSHLRGGPPYTPFLGIGVPWLRLRELTTDRPQACFQRKLSPEGTAAAEGSHL